MKTLLSTLFVISFPLISGSQALAEQTRPQIVVSGECTHTVTPDRASLLLTVEVQHPDLNQATQQASSSYERLLSKIKKLGLKNANIRSSEYSVTDVKEWEKNKNVHKGYQVRLGLWVSTSEIERMGDVIAIASKEGVTQTGMLQTYLSEEKQLQEEIACLEDASKNARQKASKLSQTLGVSLGKVIFVNETGRSMPAWNHFSRPGMRGMLMKASDEAASPTIEAGEQTLSISVQVTFAIQ